MGAWGTGVYDNDTALDIHGFVTDLIRDDKPVKSSIQQVIDQYSDELEYYDVALGLAKEQMRYDVVVDEGILKQAWGMCVSKEDIPLWVDKESKRERSKFLDEFKVEIEIFMLLNREGIEDQEFIEKIDKN
jgi:hypothetical protein